MLGFRGVRLAVAFPEIVDMQARAIFEAAIAAAMETGKAAQTEIMVPLVFACAELDFVKARIEETARAVEEETGIRPGYHLGTMIELPRAALRAGRHRADGGILLLRHQRPDADGAGHFAATTRAHSSAPTGPRAFCPPTPS